MPQKTNLNINPYFDDFSKDDNFYKVLFKPGFPVQARELTTLQSILPESDRIVWKSYVQRGINGDPWKYRF